VLGETYHSPTSFEERDPPKFTLHRGGPTLLKDSDPCYWSNDPLYLNNSTNKRHHFSLGTGIPECETRWNLFAEGTYSSSLTLLGPADGILFNNVFQLSEEQKTPLHPCAG
jgi:hypothetical protein